ncbi:MAG: hypothetical protein KDD34_03200 [Bdellovibrionales bacterium]|nr:hypothetical protein [Pseudobdellovibrionaceae bacterium]MCB0407183.1 hypothetical protein [Bdellovibrionales bacterium]|tara:strand:- start:431 stop:901 length:471 start_codon:yes stop_codon:yes gene_type:complete
MKHFFWPLIILILGLTASADELAPQRKSFECGSYYIQTANGDFVASSIQSGATLASTINGEMVLGLPDYQQLRNGDWVKTFDYSKAYLQSENEFRFVIKEVIQFYDSDFKTIIRSKESGKHFTLKIGEGGAVLFEQPFITENGSKVFNLATGTACL